MAIADDFTFDPITQTVLRQVGASETVYPLSQLYSHLTVLFDDDIQMDDLPPMSAQTPTAFTMENGWFIDPLTLRYLNGGSLTTLGWNAAIYNNGIRVFSFTTDAGAVQSDIGKPVAYSGGNPSDTGTLLYFDSSGTKWWVRVNDTGDTFQNTATAVVITGGAGTGTLSTPSSTGENVWANIFTLGSLAANSQIYLYQNDSLIIPWWDLGHLDILLLVRESGTLIDSGLVTIFVRKYTSLYDHYAADLATGARTPIPLATFRDTANATGFRTFNYTPGTSTFVVGDVIQKVSNTSIQAIITNVAIGPNSLTYYLFKYPFTDFADTDAIEIQGGSKTGTITSSPTNTGPASLSGITFTFGASTHDLNNGNGLRPYDVVIDCNNNSLASTYEYLKLVTRYGNTDTINGTTGESYIAVGEIRLPYTIETGTFTEGLTLTGAGGATGVIVALHDDGATGALILRDVTGTFVNGEAITDSATGAATAGIPETISPNKQSPFGGFAGGKFFGARGVWLNNIPGFDSNNFELIDSENIAQLPPQTISISVTSLASGDQVGIFRTTGDNEIIDRAIYTSHATSNITNATTFVVQEAIEVDTPSQGFIRIVKRDGNGNILNEDRHQYQSWFGNTFTLSGGELLLRDFTADDTAYVPYIDETSTGTSITKHVSYLTNRYVLTRVRQKGIIPFTITGQITSNGITVPAIRTADTIQT